MKVTYAILVLLASCFFWACQPNESQQETSSETTTSTKLIEMPDWVKDAVIYEVNIRQYSEEGSFDAFTANIPRLKEMGVDILWLMPIHPISEKNRKGPMGSYYSVQDYTKVNPQMGTEEDMHELIQAAHEAGMYVILDWVPNHTGFDHPWTEEHPEWYLKDSITGAITHPPGTDWTDVAALDYDNTEMRKAMIEDMAFWIEEYNIDGFRCDVAHQVPNVFWAEVNEAFANGKPIFMLAEADVESQRNEKYFHANYGWELHHIMNEIGSGEKTAKALAEYLDSNEKRYDWGFHMLFTSNHDENTWNAPAPERYGHMMDLMSVFSFTFQGIPLIYSGQESNLDERLLFFEKDLIDWGNYEKADFYAELIRLKKQNPALHNYLDLENTEIIDVTDDFIHYVREVEGNRVDVLLNFSDEQKQYQFPMPYEGIEYFSQQKVSYGEDDKVEIEPKGYMVFVKS